METLEKNKVNLVELTKFRKVVHAHPELSGKEFETKKRVLEFLADTNYSECIELAETGLLFVYDFKNPGPTVLLRTELDALPIQEVNDFEYRSKFSGVSHKCGHDGHLTMVSAVAKLIKENPLSKGRAMLLFQPAEETGKGAQAVMDDPKFKKYHPDEVFALHNLPGFPMHQIVVKEGDFTPAVISVLYKFKGKTSHAAEPEFGNNPLLALAELATFSQELVHNIPKEPNFRLVTPVFSQLGTKDYGISAGDGEMHFTLRAWKNEEIEFLKTSLWNKAQELADKYSLEVSQEFTDEFFANQNHTDSVNLIREAAKALEMDLHEKQFPNRWGEDFGLFTSSFKGAMFGLGSGEKQSALHNPDYDFPDEIIPTGASLFYELLRRRLS